MMKALGIVLTSVVHSLLSPDLKLNSVMRTVIFK